ncbi:glutamate receptor ionotropic, NMDA 1 [Nematostella vectensis]|uniref:glutamate receptor ionotropic, NMDA 1 n=1 Tax=Nematostella vectensis TaxID=45351 RepID=UPI00207710DD|nr:glutamate receptor ionotropic, NMDA 1 [Nematostella vectensis]XP_048577212.1 glutamate receptor ionotropic, NMDA 1 [Nematostella vectensis]
MHRNLEATLKEYKYGKTTCNIRRLMRKNSSNVATIKDGKLFPFDNSMRPNLLCKDPAAICVTLIPSDPVTLVGEDVVTSQADCTLGHICTQYEPVNASDPTKGKRPVLHCCYGFSIDLLVYLERDLGVQFEMYIVQDPSSWNNLVGEVVLGRADLAAAPIAITNARLKDVEYASPIQQLEIYIVMSQNRAKISLDWLAFIRPFDNSLWFVIFGLSFALVFYIWWMDQWSPYGRDNKKILSDPSNFTLPVSFSYVFSSVFKINLDDVTARSPSARFTYAVFSFGTLIMVSSYTANLTASLVQELQTFPISGIYDEKFQDPNSGFTFATEKGASVEFLLKRSANPALTSVGKNMIYSGVNTDNLELLHTGKLDAYIYYTPYIGHMASKKTGAKFKLVGKRIHSEASSFAFQKGSPWIANISSQFRKYASQEYFKETEKKWFNSLDQDVVLQAEEITLLHFRGLFLSLPVATGLSILVLVLEKYVYRRSTRKVRRIQVKGAGDGMQQPGHSESNINEKVLSIT